eukprot:865072-Alexandrium_andersonii.AAC.1
MTGTSASARRATAREYLWTEVVAVLKPDRRGDSSADRDMLTRASRSSAGGGRNCRHSAGVQQECLTLRGRL